MRTYIAPAIRPVLVVVGMDGSPWRCVWTCLCQSDRAVFSSLTVPFTLWLFSLSSPRTEPSEFASLGFAQTGSAPVCLALTVINSPLFSLALANRLWLRSDRFRPGLPCIDGDQVTTVLSRACKPSASYTHLASFNISIVVVSLYLLFQQTSIFPRSPFCL
jgi:hypothetical protein